MSDQQWPGAPVSTQPHRVPAPIAVLPNPDQSADNARADAAAANDSARLENDNARLGLSATGEARAAQGQQMNQGNALRDDYNQEPAVKLYTAAIGSLASGLQTADSAEGDNALIYHYVKVMDPTSVVNEGERESAGDGGSWAERETQKFKNMMTGDGRLPPSVRRGMRQEMIKRVDSLRTGYETQRKRYSDDAIAYGIDPMRVVGPDSGEQYRPVMVQYDKANGLGRFAPGANGQGAQGGDNPLANLPAMRGGLPAGTEPVFGMDKWGQDAPLFDRSAYLQKKYGITPDDEDWVVAFWNQNRFNKKLTVASVRAAYIKAGKGHLVDQMSDGMIEASIRDAQQGVQFTPYDTSQAEQEYRAGLQKSLEAEGGVDPQSLEGYGERGLEGATLNGIDEIRGLISGAEALVQGGNPTEAYQKRVGMERLKQEQLDAGQGFVGDAVEFVSALPTAFVLPGGSARSIGGMAKAGAGAGGVAGFNEGRGLGSSVAGGATGALIGAGAGAGIGKAADKFAGSGMGQRLSQMLSARQTPGIRPGSPAEAYQSAQKFGLDVLPGDVMGMGAKVVERGLDVQPGSAGLMNTARENLAGQLDNAVDTMAGRFGKQTGSRDMGVRVQRGAKRWTNEFYEASGKNYEAIPIAPDIDAVTVNTVGKLRELTSKVTSNDELAKQVTDKRLTGYLSALEKGRLSWNDMKQFRSQIGEEMGTQLFGEKTLKSDLKALYGALSADMEATATQQGPKALAAFRKANNFHAQGERRIENVVAELLGKDGDKSPEAAAALIQRIAKADKASSDLGKLAQVRKTLSPDEWGQVSNGLIRLAGQPANSAGREFDPAVFVRTFKDMAPGAKNLLFGKGDLRKELDEFTSVIDRIAANKGTRNTSGTGAALGSVLPTMGGIGGYSIGGLPGALLGTAIVAGGNAAAAKLWTRPAFVRWATGYSKAMGAAARTGTVNPKSHDAQMAALARIASANPVIETEARGLLQQLTAAFEGGSQRLAAQPGQSRSVDMPTTAGERQ